MKVSGGAVGTFKFGSGVITAGLDHVHITHSCGSAPSFVSVTPGLNCDAPIEVISSTISATEFVVQFVGGVVLGVDANFLWGALK